MTTQALRLQKLPPYVFAEIDEKKRELQEQGVDLIDLGVGDPDLATPPEIIKTLKTTVDDKANHRYPSYVGMKEFREAACKWMDQRFSVKVDPKTECISLIGSKEGLVHLSLGVVNPGDHALIPDPAYPVYTNATILSGGTCIYYPLKAENNFKPKWSEITDQVWKSVRLVYINFPHNPTSATVGLDTYEELVHLAKKHDFYICSDGAYSEQGYTTHPPCCLQVPGAKDRTIELFSMSKSYNMTGWRIAFAVGNKDLIKSLYRVKSTVDSGQFQPIQWAAITALQGKEEELMKPSKEVYAYRRKIMTEGLTKLGYKIFDGGATFYLWIKNPGNRTSTEITKELLEKGIVVTPGNGFGESGEGYFRIALTVCEERLKEALSRMPDANALAA